MAKTTIVTWNRSILVNHSVNDILSRIPPSDAPHHRFFEVQEILTVSGPSSQKVLHIKRIYVEADSIAELVPEE